MNKTNALPLFPKFEHLDISHKEILRSIANNFPSYSDFNFVSLFTWDIDGEVFVSSLNNNLVIKFTDYLDNSNFYSFLGTSKTNETAKTLIEYAKSKGDNTSLKLVPHSVASLVSTEQFEVIEDRDNYDYLLSVEDLVNFRTNKYRGKKNLLNRFRREHEKHANSIEIDLSNEKNKEGFLEVLNDWQLSREKSNEEVDNEFRAIKKTLEHSNALNIKAYGVYIDKRLVAFTLFEIVSNKVAIIHFDKADIGYVGLFEHLKHNLSKHLKTLGVEIINYEQDLGLQGLRRAKESYHPIDYLKKYIIKVKTR